MKNLDLDIKVSTVGEDDRPDLEGKIIPYVHGDGDTYSSLVVGCNRSVGVTLIDPNNKKHYHICLRGPALPVNDVEWCNGAYDELYDVLCLMIENGEVRPAELLEIAGHKGASGQPSGKTCAYSQ
jgi:hypothetical protein